LRLSALEIADPAERWEALGFAVGDGRLALGGVRIELGVPGSGITAWSLPAVDGLATFAPGGGPALSEHPNGAVGLDHVVIVTPDFDRTAAALDAADLTLRRIRAAAGFRQGFRRIGPAILELVETVGEEPDGPARFWGLVVVVRDIDGLASRLGGLLGTVRPAVQRGRRIATLRSQAGLGTKVAFMDPEPPGE
jgi:hypothetical protein